MGKMLGLEGATFTESQLNDAVANNKLLNIQLSIPSGCLNDCIYCFQASGKTGREVRTEDILRLLDQAHDMGLIYLQILGKGEPLLNKDFLTIVEHANRRDIFVNLFTCGDVISDDDLARKIHGMTGIELVERLKQLYLSIFVKYEAHEQDDIAMRAGYSKLRDRALKHLIDAGFNSHSFTRLGLTPVILNQNYEELRGIYKWALEQNIYPHLCPLISTGKTKDVSSRGLDIKPEALMDLAIDNIKEAIRQGYGYLGPTPFPGGVACEYLRIGLYVDNYGDVFLCSGRDTGALGNIKHDSLKSVWEGSYGKRKPYLSGHGCPWKEKDGVFPVNYYSRIDEEIKRFLASNA